MKRDINFVLYEVPNMTKHSYEIIWHAKCKEPNFITVFKAVKEKEFPLHSLNFYSYTEQERNKIKSVAEKAYQEYKQDIYFVDDERLGRILASIPEIVSNIYIKLSDKSGKKPRFDSVFKILKEEYLPRIMVDYSMLDEGQKYEIEEMAKDAYYGIREGE